MHGGEAAGRAEDVGPRSMREAVLYGIPASSAEVVCGGAVDGPEGRVAVERGMASAGRNV
ncbi:hypothetical protein ACIO3O_26565 [Streptomyces sp. NPDC087440]|uniref:hypothetical protein n=1 Tax=Streptomyces sp. NPDC087440 TaxID=3365790 RepID=UPI00381456E9